MKAIMLSADGATEEFVGITDDTVPTRKMFQPVTDPTEPHPDLAYRVREYVLEGVALDRSAARYRFVRELPL